MAAQTNFIDIATIWLHAGKGGDGAVSFHREKFVAAGGPDGGDGGRGGDIIFVADDHLSTLMDFRYKRKYTAPEGGKGGASLCHGKNAENLIIKVPLGTVIKDAESGLVIADLSDHTPVTIAKGGRGGYGNAHFATPTRQIPKFAKPGMPGEDIQVTLELKLIADVGLIGFPNVGKSTLLSVVSKARPKIANYHFTTLFPNLGVVYVEEGVSFVLADIPGIIEGAAEGAGLGHDFLRHIDRCRLLIHVVDVSGSEGRDPVADFEAIQAELKEYGSGLENRPMLVAGNKADIAADRSALEALRTHVEGLGLPFYEISAAAQQGTQSDKGQDIDHAGFFCPKAVQQRQRNTVDQQDGTHTARQQGQHILVRSRSGAQRDHRYEQSSDHNSRRSAEQTNEVLFRHQRLFAHRKRPAILHPTDTLVVGKQVYRQDAQKNGRITHREHIGARCAEHPDHQHKCNRQVHGFHTGSDLIPILQQQTFHRIFSPFTIKTNSSSILTGVRLLPNGTSSLFTSASAP